MPKDLKKSTKNTNKKVRSAKSETGVSVKKTLKKPVTTKKKTTVTKKSSAPKSVNKAKTRPVAVPKATEINRNTNFDRPSVGSNGVVKITPKIRVSRVSEMSNKIYDTSTKSAYGNDFVVDLKAKRLSYVDEHEEAIDEDLQVALNKAWPEASVDTLGADSIVKSDGYVVRDPDEIAKDNADDDLFVGELNTQTSAVDKENNKKIQQLEDQKIFEKLPADAGFDFGRQIKIHDPKIYRRIALVFGILVVLLGIGIAYFIMVRVKIVVALNEEEVAETVTAQIYDRPAEFALPDQALRGLVKRVAIEQSKLYQVSGTEVIGEEVVGQITLYNKYNKSQPLVASTRLMSASGKLYRLKNAVTVPANSSVIADIYADQAKQEMVVGAETFTVPGLWEGLQDKIYGETKVDSVKYQQKLRRIIGQHDIDQALVDIKRVILDKVKADADNTYNDYDQKMYKLDESTVTYKVNGLVGEEKEQLPVSMTAVVEVVAFSSTSAEELVKNQVQSLLSAEKEFVGLRSDETSYELQKFDSALAMAELAVTYKANVKYSDSYEIVDKHKIIGLSELQLDQYLKSIPGIKSYTVEFKPSFIRQVPSLVDRIEVKVMR